MNHKNSAGAVCAGCPPDCPDIGQSIIVGGVEVKGCCAMRRGPHGTYAFDTNGNVSQEPRCCASFSHTTGQNYVACGGHGGKPEWVEKVAGAALPPDNPGVRAQAKAKKVADSLDNLNGVTAPLTALRATPAFKAMNAAEQDAAVAKSIRDTFVTNGKFFGGGTTVDESTKVPVAEVVVLEKRVNPNNPEVGGVEWHHRDLTAAERAQVAASMRAALA